MLVYWYESIYDSSDDLSLMTNLQRSTEITQQIGQLRYLYILKKHKQEEAY